MQCPKEQSVELLDGGQLPDGPAAHRCPSCSGSWIPGEVYRAWRSQQPAAICEPLPKVLASAASASPYDGRAALCPACGHYLARVRIGQPQSFFIERCKNCQGVWCDPGEWETLLAAGLHGAIDQFFSEAWQAQVKALQYQYKERQAIVEKLGEDLASRLFDLARALEEHPDGEFGVAYLMRRFDS
ncbi:MAG: zf-TFIIB domain-containing protein [Elainellaceae cyanobacterium]